MARLNDPVESDDDLPELSTILGLPKQEYGKMPPQRQETQDLANDDSLTERHAMSPRTVTKNSSDRPQSGKQRPLGQLNQAHVNSLLLPMPATSISNSGGEEHQSIQTADRELNRASPRRSIKASTDYDKSAQMLGNTNKPIHHDDDSSTEFSGFIVPDSASDGEVSVSPKKKKSRTQKKVSRANPQEPNFQVSQWPPSDTRQTPGTTDLISPGKVNGSRICLDSPPSNESFKSELVEAHPDPNNRLALSPPRFRPPHVSEHDYQPLTPPSSPSKSKLKSPSKRQRIPPSPHRPSIDAFWSQDVINDWNEQYSPQKIVGSPRKFRLHSVDQDEDESPSESPRRSQMKSPAKKDKKIIERRKLFDDRKHGLATAFLAEVDQTITNGQVASMAHSTGGIQIIWSKKLSSTAGRANWRREAIRSKVTDGLESSTTCRHHAFIELAEKVIDDEDRLVNVIAHEYCHLANFMISGVKDNPHGKEFKEWARKCTKAFAHRGIDVTTKHAYAIAYKYIWTCTSPACGLEYKRHSKSIDPSIHSCGSCKGKLVQVQPAPRKGAGEGKRSEYQDFVKGENNRVRLENPGVSFGEIMSILGREFKQRKRDETERASGVKEHSAREKTGSKELECLDSVAETMGFLNLES